MLVDDNGEMVKIGFGTLPAGLNAGSPDEATITLMNVEEELSVSCEGNEIWCATVHLPDAYSMPPYEEYQIIDWRFDESDREFTYGGITYEVTSIGFHPDPRPNGAHNSWFSFGFSLYTSPSEDHLAEWKLYVEDIEVSFKEIGEQHGDFYSR